MRGWILFVIGTAVIAALAPLAGAMAADSEIGTSKLQSTQTAMLDWDFTDEISCCDGIGFEDQNTPRAYRCLNHAWELPERALSKRELMASAIWEMPGGDTRIWTDTLIFVQGYFIKHGQMPGSGAELMQANVSSAHPGLSLALSKLDLMKRVWPGVNPITGKFYASFSSNIWSPGGFFTERMHSPVEYHGSRLIPSAGRDLWHTVIFGEQPGTVLVDTYTYTRNE